MIYETPSGVSDVKLLQHTSSANIILSRIRLFSVGYSKCVHSCLAMHYATESTA